MRVYEIAKEVGLPNKDLIAKIRALGLEVNNHMSSLDADDVARIKRSLEKERQSVAQPQQTQRLAPGGTVLRRRITAPPGASRCVCGGWATDCFSFSSDRLMRATSSASSDDM